MRVSTIPWVLVGLLIPAVTHAQVPGRIDGGFWRPELSLDPNALPYVEGTLVPGAGSWNAGVTLEYVRNPLVTTDARGNTTAIVRDQFWTTFSAQIGIGTHLAAGLQVPALVVQTSDLDPVANPATATAGIGDLRGVLRWSTRAERSTTGQRTGSATAQTQRQTEQREGFGLSLALAATAPTAGTGTYAGAGAPTVHAFGILDFRLARILGAVSLGYRARLDGHWPAQSGDCTVGDTGLACLDDTPLRDQFTWGFAIRQPLEGLISLIFLRANPNLASAAILTGYLASTYVTFQGAVDARAPFARSATSPVEMGAGLQRQQGEFTLTAGAAWGLVAAAGTAAPRVIVGLQWSPRFIDEDGDGFRDDPAIDHCIGLPEDFDGFQDDDGCPEDNDHDAVPDEEDRCPFQDEDEDGFQDEDGCPDPDNDGDGVLDENDVCPNEAQGEHPDPARTGCPLVDRDHDGVGDTDDRCPDEPAGEHPDPALPGCPVRDHDHDGVPDAEDRCPDEPVGEHPVPAQHGCPETDRDHDGVPDARDRCPDQPESLNGVADEDGCPETGVVPGAHVRVRVLHGSPEDPGTVELTEPVRFDPRDGVLAASRPVLAQLAVALRATARRPWRWYELSVPVTPPAVHGPAAVDAARANRRRDAVLAVLRESGVGESVVRAGEPARPLAPRTPDRGIVLVVHQEP